jgi:hypothetical protein
VIHVSDMPCSLKERTKALFLPDTTTSSIYLRSMNSITGLAAKMGFTHEEDTGGEGENQAHDSSGHSSSSIMSKKSRDGLILDRYEVQTCAQ